MSVVCIVTEQCAECEIHEVKMLTSLGPAPVASILKNARSIMSGM
jgi:hypothetical protein